MRKTLILAVALLSIGTAYGQDDDVTVSEVLQLVKNTIARVQSDADALGNLPNDLRVRVNLKAEFQREQDGVVNLIIVRFGKAVRSEFVHTLSIELGSLPLRFEFDRNLRVSDVLADAIISAAKAVNEANFADQNLGLNRLSAAIRFGINSESQGAWGIEVLGLMAEGGRVVSQSEVQEIIIEFRAPASDAATVAQ